MQQEDSFSLINILFQGKESTNVKKIFDIIRSYESLNNQHIHIQARKKALHNVILSAASIYGKNSLTSQTTNIYPIQNQSIELKKQFLKQQQLLKYQLQRYNQSSQKAKQKLRIKFQNIYRQCKENSDFIVKKEYFKLIGILLNNYGNIRNRVLGRGNVAIATRNRNPRKITSSIKQRTRQLLEDCNSYHEIKRIVKIPISSIKAIKNRMIEI